MIKEIAFLAISQAHQFLHWLPAALRLAREPDVRVTVLVSSQAGLDFIRGYDPDRDPHARQCRDELPAVDSSGLEVLQ